MKLTLHPPFTLSLYPSLCFSCFVWISWSSMLLCWEETCGFC